MKTADRGADRFPLGQVVGTPGALEAMKRAGQEPSYFLSKHIQGDWGQVPKEDKQLNEDALRDGDRIHSAYKTANGETLWIITEADRSVTTILTPDEY